MFIISKLQFYFFHHTEKTFITNSFQFDSYSRLIKMANKRNLLLLFERKLEPVFMEKGLKNAVFNVPDKLLSDRYKGKPSIK